MLFRSAISADPANVKAKINLAVLCLEEKQVDTAITLLLDAYARENNNFEANNNLGNAYKMKGDYKNAIEYYCNALKIQPRDTVVKENLAKAYVACEQWANAKSVYEDVIKANTENYDAFFDLAKVCISLNENSEAEKYLVYIQEKNPSFKSEEVKALLQSVK